MTCITEKIKVGDVGTVFRATITEDGVAKDISTATSITFKFKKPDKSTFTQAGTVEDGPNGVVSYTTQAGEVDIAGRWWIEVTVALPAWTATTNEVSFWVEKVL